MSDDLRERVRRAIISDPRNATDAAMLEAWPNTGEFTINGERKLVLPLEVKP